jgi:hypothetical protein
MSADGMGRVGAGDGRVRADVTSGEIRVAPGEPVEVEVEVTNVTEVIRAYRVDVLGLDARWATVDAVDLELFPGERRTTTLTVDLPDTYPAGRRRIAVEVSEPGEPDGSVVVVDVDVVVEPRDGLSFGVEPASMTVGPEGTFVVTPVNTGNTTLDLEMVAADPERKVAVTFEPAQPRLLPGERGVVRATARGPRPWFGMPLVRVLEFRVKGGSAEAFTAAAFIQTPRLSRRAVTLAGLVVVATLFAFVIFLSFSSVADLSAQQEALLKQSLGEDQPVGVRIEPSSIAGRATSTTGGGIDGVSVELYTSANAVVPAKSTVTDIQGTYRFGSLLPDTYFVRFRVAGFGESWFRRGTSIADATAIELVAGQELVDVDIALGGQPGAIVGRVIGEEVEGALVVAQIPGSSIEGSDLAPVAARLASMVVDASGEYRLEPLPTPAAYEVVVTRAGFAPQVRLVSLGPGEERTDLEVLLRRGGGVIAGTVVDLGGTAIAGANVVVSDGQTRSTTRTLSEPELLGTFDVRELPTPGTYSLEVAAEGFFTETQTVTLAQDQQVTDLEVVLTAAQGSITGRVVNGSGRPLGGIEVAVLGPGSRVTTQTVSIPVGFDPSIAPAGTLDATGLYPAVAGTWRIDGLPLPGAYTVVFDAPGVLAQSISVNLTPGAGALRSGVDAVLNPATGSVSGRVFVAGTPANTAISAEDGVRVTLRSTALTRELRPVDLPVARKGEFRFDNVPPAAYTLTVTRPGSTPQTFLVNTSARADFTADLGSIVLDRRAAISGTIRPFQGFVGLRRYAVDVFTPEAIGVPVVPRTTTDLDGSFTITGMFAPARYVLRFEDLETREVFTLPNSRQTMTDGSDVIDLEPGFPFDLNAEILGAKADGTEFSPYTTFTVITGGVVPVLASEPASPVAGDLYVVQPLAGDNGTLRFFNGEQWVNGPEVSVASANSGQLGEVTFTAPPAPHEQATRLAFQVQPTSVTWNASTGSAALSTVEVRVLDSQGNQVTTGPASQAVIALSSSDSALGLLGTNLVRAKGGAATFSDLRLLRAGNSVRLVANGMGFTAAQSDAFNVAAIAPAAPSLVILDSGPVVNWGLPFSDGGRDFTTYFVVASGSTAPYSRTACSGESGVAPSVPASIQALNQPVFYRRVPGPLSCGFTAPAGSGIRFRVYAVNAAGLVSPASGLTSGSVG